MGICTSDCGQANILPPQNFGIWTPTIPAAAFNNYGMYGSGMMPGAMPGVMGYGPGIGGPMMAGAPGTTTTTTVTTM